MHHVISYFIDLQDGEHPYNVGDAFPREGHSVSEERIAELSSSRNKRKKPLIEKVEVAPVQPEKAEKAPEAEPVKEEPKKAKVAAVQKEAKSDRSRASGNAQSKSRKKK